MFRKTWMKRVWDNSYTFWLVLSLPAIAALARGFGPDTYKDILHITGELSARLMIVALMITPMRMIWPKARWLTWLMRRRRYLGVAAFGYAFLHMVVYLAEKGMASTVLAEAFDLAIWTGWLALVIFIPLAATSNSFSTRALGRWWKSLQRLIYLAAVLTLIHWVAVTEGYSGLANFIPLAVLEMYRVWSKWNQSAQDHLVR